jgi:two-component system sensor histidine kinase SenX3
LQTHGQTPSPEWTATGAKESAAPTRGKQWANEAPTLSTRDVRRLAARSPLLTMRHVRSTPAEPEPPSQTAAVLATVAAALETGAVLLDDDDVLLANEAALALRVVFGRELTSRMLSRIARDARRTGKRVTQDVDLPWGASSRAVHVVAAPVPGTAQVVLLLSDLEEVRRLEAVRRDFIANVSHELKTPVGAMLLLAEALRDATDDPVAIKQFTDRITREAGRMSRLVQELLELSRLQGGEPLPAMEVVRVSDVVADAADPLQVRADAAGMSLEIGLTPGLTVWGDRRQLATALTNLIENAIAYSARGSRVGVGARTEIEDGVMGVAIAVSDEGVGIEKADQERVFERFYRIDTARSRATGGTGLGLAIVKHVANNHGGRVGLWSYPGVGSTFTLHLPVPPVAATDDHPQPRDFEKGLEP